jgi:hypothetical protein
VLGAVALKDAAGAHIVFRKRYASKSGFLRAEHEAAYLLAKGEVERPALPISDVLEWRYTGSRLHPTQKPVEVLTPLIEAFSRPGAQWCWIHSAAPARRSSQRATPAAITSASSWTLPTTLPQPDAWRRVERSTYRHIE